MKKVLFVITMLILIATVSVYTLIPHTIALSKIVYTNVNSTSVIRSLHNDTAWLNWFPGKKINKNTFSYDKQIYQPGIKTYASNNVLISDKNNSYSTEINILPISVDSSAIQWKLQIAASANPFKRIKQYQFAKRLKNNITILLNSFKKFVADTKNIYGFDIKHTTLTDTVLVSIKTTSKLYPSTKLIYTLIDQLKKYIKEQHALEHNYPMLNITPQGDSCFEVMVGISTNVPLEGTNIIKPKRMIMIKNKTLITYVVGDISSINKALQATTNYMNDNQLAPPVIPFQQLVTDRSKMKDSTKWITRIFSPII